MQSMDENQAVGSCIINPDPRSRATVRLSSTDINDPPTVDTNLLAMPEEVERMVMCFEREREFGDALDSLGFNLTEVLPGFATSLEDSVRFPFSSFRKQGMLEDAGAVRPTHPREP